MVSTIIYIPASLNFHRLNLKYSVHLQYNEAMRKKKILKILMGAGISLLCLVPSMKPTKAVEEDYISIFEVSMNDPEPFETIKKEVIQAVSKTDSSIHLDKISIEKSLLEAQDFIPGKVGFQQVVVKARLFNIDEKDSDKNIGYSFTKKILLKVNPSNKPVIKLKSDTVVVNNGDDFNPSTHVSSIYDETNVLPVLTTQGTVDMKKDGTYFVHYKAIDTNGIQFDTKLTVKVVTPAEVVKARKEATMAKTAKRLSKEHPTIDESSLAKAEIGGLQFNSRGLLVEKASPNAQLAINMLLRIPGHSRGSTYHQVTGLDKLIDSLSTAEAVYVIHRIEGAGFGQLAAGYAGSDTPATHRAFVSQQVNRRFGGSIHQLLKKWGTYSYTGY